MCLICWIGDVIKDEIDYVKSVYFYLPTELIIIAAHFYTLSV